MSEIMLSIYIPAFNHEKYIAQALDSVLMQETNFSYEVLIGEDKSEDGTAAVLREYELRYPGRFQVFYREENMFDQIPRNCDDLRHRCRGRYVIALEGDDYWLDAHKLQKQVSFLETHPDYIAVAHNCIVVDDDSNPGGGAYPECNETEYSWNYYMHGTMPGQLTTVMYRNIYKDDQVDTSVMEQGFWPYDRLLYFILLTYGRVYCMQEAMSAYRYVTTHGSSFSATIRRRSDNFIREERMWHGLLNYAKQFGADGQKAVGYLYFSTIAECFRNKGISYREFRSYYKNVLRKFFSVRKYIKNYILKL